MKTISIPMETAALAASIETRTNQLQRMVGHSWVTEVVLAGVVPDIDALCDDLARLRFHVKEIAQGAGAAA